MPQLAATPFHSLTPWLNLDSHFQVLEPARSKKSQTNLTAKPRSYDFEAYQISGIGSSRISTESLDSEGVCKFRRSQSCLDKAERGSRRAICFLSIDSKLREEILHREISLFPKEGCLPSDLSSLLKKLGIGEERFIRVLNLAATGRYRSEQNRFNSFCIPEHVVVYKDLPSIQPKTDKEAAKIFDTHLISVIYSDEVTIVIGDGKSPSIKQLQENLKDGSLEYFKRADRLPCITSIIKDIVEANCISCQRVLRIFDDLKDRAFKANDTTIVAALKMALAELQNYWITEEDPVSGMEKLLKGVQKDSAHMHSLLNKPERFRELLENIQLTTQKVHQLNRSVILREDARRAGVESRSQYISATLAALGSAFLPNATVTQIPIGDWNLQLVAHGVATLLSLTLLLRMKRLGWFDFVTENFGDLFGLKGLFKSLRCKNIDSKN